MIIRKFQGEKKEIILVIDRYTNYFILFPLSEGI